MILPSELNFAVNRALLPPVAVKPSSGHRNSRGDEGYDRQRQRLEALVLPSNTALIGGAGLFGVIHVIDFSCD